MKYSSLLKTTITLKEFKSMFGKNIDLEANLN